MSPKEYRNLLLQIDAAIQENPPIAEEYKKAVLSEDLPVLTFFASMGIGCRQQIINTYHYRHGLLFGQRKKVFNECGWIIESWLETETIEILLNGKSTRNSINLAKGLNGKYAFSICYNYGSHESGSSLPSYFCRPFTDRNTALIAGLAELKKIHETKLKFITKRPDSTKPKYLREILHEISCFYQRHAAPRKQLSLFEA